MAELSTGMLSRTFSSSLAAPLISGHIQPCSGFSHTVKSPLSPHVPGPMRHGGEIVQVSIDVTANGDASKRRLIR